MFWLKKLLSKRRRKQLLEFEPQQETSTGESVDSAPPIFETSDAEKPAHTLIEIAKKPDAETVTTQDPIMKKWQAFYDLYLPPKDHPQVEPADINVPQFRVYTEGAHVMNSPYIEVNVYAEKGVYYYTYSGGTTHMNGFCHTGVIPSEYIRDNCVVLGAVLALTGGAYGFISSTQMDSYLLVDFAGCSVHPLKNAVCSVCGNTIDVFTQKESEPLCINGEIFCRKCFKKEHWRQTIIKEYLAVGKRGDCYYYASKPKNIYDGDYSGRIPSSLFHGSELDISKLLTHIISMDEDGYYEGQLKKLTIPYVFDVESRRLKGDENPCCADCGASLVDKNIKDNCISLSNLLYEADKKPYCSRCKANNNWAIPVYTVDGFAFRKDPYSWLGDYTIYLGMLNKQPVCYIHTDYMQDGYGLPEDWHKSPILLPSTLMTDHTIAIHALLTYLKEQGEIKHLPEAYCDNYYSFDFQSRKLVLPDPFVCSECGTALEESNVVNGMLDCTDSLCSIDNKPFCVHCFIKHRGETAYHRRVKENMIFLFKYNVLPEDKRLNGNCDIADLYIDPKNGKTYMDLHRKTKNAVQNSIPLKQIPISRVLNSARKYAPEFFEKYKAMNENNWSEFIGAIQGVTEIINTTADTQAEPVISAVGAHEKQKPSAYSQSPEYVWKTYQAGKTENRDEILKIFSDCGVQFTSISLCEGHDTGEQDWYTGQFSSIGELLADKMHRNHICAWYAHGIYNGIKIMVNFKDWNIFGGVHIRYEQKDITEIAILFRAFEQEFCIG